MIDARRTLNSFIPITQFNRGKASEVISRLADTKQIFILKNNKPEAVILSPEEFMRLSDIEEDYELLCQATAAMQQDDGTRYSAAEVRKQLKLSDKDISSAEEPEIE